MEDLTYVKLVDLDRSTCNKIIIEHPSEGYLRFIECPHHIIVNVIKVVAEVIKQQKLGEENPVLQQTNDTRKILEEYHKDLMKTLTNIKNEITEIKSKI